MPGTLPGVAPRCVRASACRTPPTYPHLPYPVRRCGKRALIVDADIVGHSACAGRLSIVFSSCRPLRNKGTTRRRSSLVAQNLTLLRHPQPGDVRADRLPRLRGGARRPAVRAGRSRERDADGCLWPGRRAMPSIGTASSRRLSATGWARRATATTASSSACQAASRSGRAGLRRRSRVTFARAGFRSFALMTRATVRAQCSWPAACPIAIVQMILGHSSPGGVEEGLRAPDAQAGSRSG